MFVFFFFIWYIIKLKYVNLITTLLRTHDNIYIYIYINVFKTCLREVSVLHHQFVTLKNLNKRINLINVKKVIEYFRILTKCETKY